MKKFTVQTQWATYRNCVLKVGEYANNKHVAISIWSMDEGPIADLTVNVSGINRCEKNMSAVDVNNFPEVRQIIAKLGIGMPTVITLPSGFCSYPVYRFDMEKLNEYTKG